MIALAAVHLFLSMSGAADAGPSAASSAPAAATAPAGKKPSKDDPDKVICQVEEVTGSHRPQKICMTRHEWQVLSDQSRQGFNAVRDQGRTTLPSGGIGGPH